MSHPKQINDDLLIKIIKKAVERTRDRNYQYMTLELVFEALMDEKEIIDTLFECGFEVEVMNMALTNFCDDQGNNEVLTKEKREKIFKIQQSSSNEYSKMDDYVPAETALFHEFSKRIRRNITSQGASIVEHKHILVALVETLKINFEKMEDENFKFNHFLTNLFISTFSDAEDYHDSESLLNVLEEILISLKEHYTRAKHLDFTSSNNKQKILKRNKVEKTKEDSILENFCTNLTEIAKKDELDPLIGRGKELSRVIHVLSRRGKNNPILIGDAGVGKTAIITNGLAQLIANGEVPENLKTMEIFSLSLSALMANTKYRGELEGRIKTIIEEIKERKNIILFIDEIHNLIGMGGNNQGGDIANLIKDDLTNNYVRIIGSTTAEEYQKIVEKENAFDRRFNQVKVDEPSVTECIDILKGIKTEYEKFHKVSIDDTGIEEAVKLSDKYITNRCLPDKAIDLLDESATSVKLAKKNEVVNEDVVSSVFEKVNGIKINLTKVNSEQNIFKSLSKDIKSQIYGQDKNIDTIVSDIMVAKSGLNRPNKPLNTFLFLGPTGVGKTAFCYQLQEKLGMKLKRFDMSEYGEKHSSMKFFGAPPSYVGYENGGLLTNYVRNNPESIILLDEFEKAHTDVADTFLQVFDEGILTDSLGKTADFKNCIIILTSNLGIKGADKSSIGLSQSKKENKEDYQKKLMNSLKAEYKPEFINRIDNILCFNRLNEEMIINVAEKFVNQLSNRLSEKLVNLHLDGKAYNWLAKNGYDEKMGARPMERLIAEKINRPIAQEIVMGKLNNGGTVKITVKDDELSFDFRKPRKRRKTKIKNHEISK